MALDKIIKNYEGMKLAPNELLTNAALNRIFGKLLENDTKLIAKAENISNGIYRILPWIKGKTYNKNDLVWFVDVYVPPGNETKYENTLEEIEKFGESVPNSLKEELENCYTVTLYLLRSLENGNNKQPVRTIIDMVPYFDASGWHNENPIGSIYTDYFQEFTIDNIKKELDAMHQAVANYHPFGKLALFSDIPEKVLKTDMSNTDPDRKKVFFPNETFAVDDTSHRTIISGSCRKWDCGLLEYDIIFRLGDSAATYSDYNVDGSLKMSQEIDSNYLNLAKSSFNRGSLYEYNNRKYYLDDSDSDIFVIPEGFTVSENGIVQHNIDKRLNSYCGTIEFDIPFIDTNYCIFPVTMPSASNESEQLMTNENTLVFVNKSKKTVTAMLIISNYNQAEYKVLGNNQFRCRITGRWR